MTSAVARVDFQWFSFLLRKSHWTKPSLRASCGESSIKVLSAKAWVSIVSLYQSHALSSGAQKVPWSWEVFAESITLEKTRSASEERPILFNVRASMPLRYGEWRFQCLKLWFRIALRSSAVKAFPTQE